MGVVVFGAVAAGGRNVHLPIRFHPPGPILPSCTEMMIFCSSLAACMPSPPSIRIRGGGRRRGCAARMLVGRLLQEEGVARRARPRRGMFAVPAPWPPVTVRSDRSISPERKRRRRRRRRGRLHFCIFLYMRVRRSLQIDLPYTPYGSSFSFYVHFSFAALFAGTFVDFSYAAAAVHAVHLSACWYIVKAYRRGGAYTFFCTWKSDQVMENWSRYFSICTDLHFSIFVVHLVQSFAARMLRACMRAYFARLCCCCLLGVHGAWYIACAGAAGSRCGGRQVHGQMSSCIFIFAFLYLFFFLLSRRTSLIHVHGFLYILEGKAR